jgi:hypothetical protein
MAGNFLASAMCAVYQLIVVGKGCVGCNLILQVLFLMWKGFIRPCFAGSVLDVERFYMTLFCRSCTRCGRYYMTLFCRSFSRCGKVLYDIILQVHDLLFQVLFSMRKG